MADFLKTEIKAEVGLAQLIVALEDIIIRGNGRDFCDYYAKRLEGLARLIREALEKEKPRIAPGR